MKRVPALGEIESQLPPFSVATVVLQSIRPCVTLMREIVRGAGLAPPGVVAKGTYCGFIPIYGRSAWRVEVRHTPVNSRTNHFRDLECRKYSGYQMVHLAMSCAARID